jgi:hypothetical protein
VKNALALPAGLAGSLTGQVRNLDYRPDFDGPFARTRNPFGNFDGFVEILGLDQEVAAKLFAGFGEGTVGH